MYAKLNYGILDYIYLKLTDKPNEKLVNDLTVKINLLSTQSILSPCGSDSTTASSNCYYLLRSDNYVGIRIFPTRNTIGTNCSQCLTSAISSYITYNLTGTICSANNILINGSVEGRSYFMFIKDWEVLPNPFKLIFSWPKYDNSPRIFSLGNLYFYSNFKYGSRTSIEILLDSSIQLSNVDYMSWSPSHFIGECLYGADVTSSLTGLLTALLVLGIFSLISTCVLVGWSKFAEWRWNGGGKFEWERGESDNSSHDSDVPDDHSIPCTPNRAVTSNPLSPMTRVERNVEEHRSGIAGDNNSLLSTPTALKGNIQ